MSNVKSGKTAAITSYILVIGVFIAMSMNTDEDKTNFASFHIRQALGLSILFISFGLIISNFDSWMITAPMYFCVSVLWMYGLFTAASGSMTPIPLVGGLFQKLFRKI